MNTLDTPIVPVSPSQPAVTTPTATPAPAPTRTPAPAPSGNDNATPKRLRKDPRLALAAPALVHAVEATLIRHGVAARDLADRVADVQVLVLEAVRDKPLPADEGGWTALACTVAERLAIKARVRTKKRARWNDGPCEAPDDHTPVQRSPGRTRDPVDTRRQLEALFAQIDAGEMPEHGEVILLRTADGVSARAIGEEIGLPATTVEHRLATMRRRFHGKLASLGLLLVLMLVWMLFGATLGGGVGHPAPEAAPDAPGGSMSQKSTPTHAEKSVEGN